MRSYYHINNQCPSCNSPYNVDDLQKAEALMHVSTLKDFSIFRCKNCSAVFKDKAYLPKYKDITAPFHQNNSTYFPLYRKVSLNCIERDYVDWFSRQITGIHLITWPWKDTRFLPIAITECVENNPNVKILVLTFSENDETNLEYSISKLFSSDVRKETSNFDLQKITKKDITSGILFKRDVVNYKIFKRGKRTSEREGTSFESLIKTRNRILNEIKESFTENDDYKGIIRSVSPPLKNDKYGLLDPEKGIYDLKFSESNEWSADVKKIKYNISTMNEVLNIENLKYARDTLMPITYDKNNYNFININKKSSLYIFNINPEYDKIDDVMSSIIPNVDPDIIIIQNADSYISDIRYSGKKSKALINFLSNITTQAVILFSNDPECRQYYFETKNNFLDKLNINVHTVDSIPVLNEYSRDDSDSLSAYSSGTIPKDRLPEIKVDYISHMDDFYPSLSPYLPKIKDSYINSIRRYLQNLLFTTLNVIDEDPFKEFVSRKPHTDYEVKYEQIIESISDCVDREILPVEFKEKFDEIIAKYYSNGNNPLRNEIFNVARNIRKTDKDAVIFVVVDSIERKGLKKIIEENEEIRSLNLIFTRWNRINIELKNIDDTSYKPRIYAISAKYPTMEFKITESPISKYIFINDTHNIQRIQQILSKRVWEKSTRPLKKSKFPINMPNKLQEITSNDDLYSDDKPVLDEILSDESDTEADVISFESHNVYSSGQDDSSIATGKLIPKGSDAILCVNQTGEGLFIPLDTSVMYRKSDLFDDLRIESNMNAKDLTSALVDKEIIVGKNYLYSSFKGIFFRYMIQHQNNIRYERLPYQWNNYSEMYFDMIRWINYIEQAIEFVIFKHKYDSEDAQLVILTILSNSGITAKDLNTLNLWLKPIDEVIIEDTSYYLYRTEHPFKRTDMQIIYDTLKKYVINSESYDLDKSYAAALNIQLIRNRVLNATDKSDNTTKRIHAGLKKELSKILGESKIFIPKSVQRVCLEKDVQSQKILANYEEYIS